MTQVFERKLCSSERLWVAIERECPRFAVQLCIVGEGDLTPARLEAAVAKASEACPGARVRLSGHLGWTRWRDTRRTPEVRVLDGEGWDGLSPRGMPAFEDRLDPRRGPTAEVHFLRGDPVRLVFRALHASMDGIGTLTWTRDVFRALRGEEPVGAASTLSDFDLVRELQPERRHMDLPNVCYSPTGPAGGPVPPGEPAFDWRRVEIPGRVLQPLARTIDVVVAETLRLAAEDLGPPGKVRISVPVDMRRYRPGLVSTSNLTSGVLIEGGPETTVDVVRDEVRRQIAEQRDLDYVRMLEPLAFVPIGAMRAAARATTARCHKRARYPSSATVSTLGLVDPADFSADGFQARYLFALPSTGGVETCPLTVALVGTTDALQVTVFGPRTLVDGGRLDALTRRIERALSS